MYQWTTVKLRRSKVSPAALLLGTRPVSGLIEPTRSPEEPGLDVAQDKAYWGSVAMAMSSNIFYFYFNIFEALSGV